MAFIVTEKCNKCEPRFCIKVCPTDAFYEVKDILVIHPDECIECTLCEPECPEGAIFADNELPNEYLKFIEYNFEKSQIGIHIQRNKSES